MRWYARPENDAQQLKCTPRPASWNAANHPDQRRLKAYLDDTEELVADRRIVAAPWALRLDIGAPITRDLLAQVADLDNYALPLADRLKDSNLVSVWCTKQHDEHERSFVRIEGARELQPPTTGVVVVRTTASSSSVDYKKQIYTALVEAGVDELPAGTVRLELSFVIGTRGWMGLWKPTIDALEPLLGRTSPVRNWHPLDGRIVELGMHVAVDPGLRHDVVIGIAATSMGTPLPDAFLRQFSWETREGGGRRRVFGHRVTCPECGAMPAEDCCTPDGRHHAGRMAAFDRSRVVADQLGFGDPCCDSWPDDVLAAFRREYRFDSIAAEMEEILIGHPRTRYAQVLAWMRAGLTNAEMSEQATKEGQRIKVESIAYVRKLLDLSLSDKLVSAPSDASNQAAVYRELLNHPPLSDGLRHHIDTKLADLRKLDPLIPLTPLGKRDV